MNALKLAAVLVFLTVGFVESAAAITIPGCGDFAIFSRNSITFEKGATELTGNVFVQNPLGTIHFGAFNILHGTASAHNIVVGGSAVVDKCVADNIAELGTGKCVDKESPFDPTPGCLIFPPFPIPGFPATCVPGTAAIITGTQTLAPGCYASVRVALNSTLTLVSGETYFVAGEFRQKAGSNVIGGTGFPDTQANVVLKGSYLAEAGVTLTNVKLLSLNTGGQAIHLGIGSIETDVEVVTLGDAHIHLGSQFRGDSGVFADSIVVEPVSGGKSGESATCACPDGFHFFLPTAIDSADRLCVSD